jgi:hypothetical protein
MKFLLCFFVIGTMAVYSSVSFADKYSFSPLGCHAVYSADSSCFVADNAGYLATLKNNCSTTKELLCPISTSSYENTDSDVIDYVKLVTNDNSTKTHYLYYYNLVSMQGQLTSSQGFGGTYSEFTWSTDLSTFEMVSDAQRYPTTFAIRVYLAAGKAVLSYHIAVK